MDYTELRVAATRAGLSNKQMAEALELSDQAFYNKINGKTEFKGSEIKRLACILSLDMHAVNHIFFNDCVN